MRDRIEIHIGAEQQNNRTMYRAELWVKPFSGWMLASTRWVLRRSQATKDGHRVFAKELLAASRVTE